MPNIEIKAPYQDLTRARETCLRLGARHHGLDRQIDTYFAVPNGRFKLRESSLSGPYLIPNLRSDVASAKKSDYTLIPVKNASETKRLFSELLGVDAVVSKTREIYFYENVRIHLDDVDGAGLFFELEAVYENDTEEQRRLETAKVHRLMREFDIDPSMLNAVSYQQLTKDGSL
jgi:adenylate cyclase class 2